ncbi:MAG: YerC/YecD family TrpR-related protein [Christensenellales bacterium]|jgi:TrpR-related protein YerC/YecD
MAWREDADVKQFLRAVLTLQNEQEALLFFQDVCTIKELNDMAKRLEAARMLSQGSNYREVTQATGMSTATISRVNRCLVYGEGGYRAALSRLNPEDTP